MEEYSISLQDRQSIYNNLFSFHVTVVKFAQMKKMSAIYCNIENKYLVIHF